MKRLVLIAGIVMTALAAVATHASVQADGGPAVRIVLLQAAGTDAKFERVDIQNLTSETIDLTGWKLNYKSASGSTTTQLLQLAGDSGWHVLLDAGRRETFVSKELAAGSPLDSALRSASQFSAGLNHLGGGLQLLDVNDKVVDAIGWGTASEAVRQGGAALPMTSTTWLLRHAASGNNSVDFMLEPQDTSRFPVAIGSLYEVQDVCDNLPGIQLVAPDDYVYTGGSCQPLDICGNLDGLQMTLPDGYEYDELGLCQVIDLCSNHEGIQEEIPAGYELTAERVCEVLIPVRHVWLTELLPNPSGSDDGNEFIELYNADTVPVALKDYQLIVGEKRYRFPVDRIISPLSYLTVSDSELGLHLPNTTGQEIRLATIRHVEVASAPAYSNAKDDVSWALIDGSWRYTYAATPGSVNVQLDSPPCEEGYVRDDVTQRCRKVVVIATSTLTPCRDGQYRSEETGRCRNITAPAARQPCREGQYRNEETNRCRSLATLATSATRPCGDDQFRNPLTNRCKKIASTEEMAMSDCGEGRERNPATNRCRNVVSTAAPALAFGVEPVKDTAAAFAGWWAIGGVGALAAGYAGWEWRREVLAGIVKIRQVFTHK